jgi:hypothetical protein
MSVYALEGDVIFILSDRKQICLFLGRKMLSLPSKAACYINTFLKRQSRAEDSAAGYGHFSYLFPFLHIAPWPRIQVPDSMIQDVLIYLDLT